MQASRRLTRSIATALALAVAPGMAAAGQLDYTLRTGLQHSDNINLSQTDPTGGNVLIPGAGFTFTQRGSTVQANVIGDLEYRDYLGGRYDNQTLARIAGRANWTMIPQRLDFSFEDSAGVAPISALAVDTPSNQQQTNVLALGPTLHFSLGKTMRGQAELHYINSYASKTKAFNSSRGVAALRLFKDLGPNSQLSANFETQHVEFMEDTVTVSPDYDSTNVFARYNSTQAHFDVDIALGWSRIDFDHAPTQSSPLIRAALGWRPSEQSSFSLEAQRQYSDAAMDMLGQPGHPPVAAIVHPDLSAPGLNTGDVIIGSQAYLQERAQLTYTFNADRVTMSIAPLYEKLDYVNDDTLDRTARGGTANLDFRLRENLTLSAFADARNYTYHSLVRRDEERRYGASLIGQRTSHWGWRLSVTHRKFDSTVPNIGYSANEIYLGVVYQR